MFMLGSDWVQPLPSFNIQPASCRVAYTVLLKEGRVMRKFRLFAAIFVFTMVAGCTDFAPTAPQWEDDYDGLLGSGD